MPSPRITRHKKPKPPLPPRARQLAELMAEGVPWKNAATQMSIGQNTARTYRGYPAFKGYYLNCLAEIRDGERGRNLMTAVEIRDDETMKRSAAGGRVRIEAARFIEGRDGGIDVNVNVGLGVNVAPGYQVSLSAEHVDGARKLLKAAGSKRNLLEDEATDAVVIDEDAPRARRVISTPVTEIDEVPEPAASPQRREAFNLFKGPVPGAAAEMKLATFDPTDRPDGR